MNETSAPPVGTETADAPDPPLMQLVDEAETWEFFAAVRAVIAAHPGAKSPGRAARIDEEPIRFKQRATARFEPSPLVEARWAPRGEQTVMEISQVFFGPLGPNGPLPTHVTLDALREARLGRNWLAEFLDIFTHRMTSFFYRGWEAAQLAVSRELGPEDPYPAWIGSLIGIGPETFHERDALPDDTKRLCAGWLASGRRSAAAIEGVLQTLIGAPVSVREFVPEWLTIPCEEESRLGVQGATLGADTVIGPRYYSRTSRIRLRSSRLSFAQFEALLPVGDRHRALRDAMRHLLCLATAWELQLVLARADVPPLRLDGMRRLGWDTWAPQPKRSDDPDDVILIGTYTAPNDFSVTRPRRASVG